jgi:peroxiredoxin
MSYRALRVLAMIAVFAGIGLIFAPFSEPQRVVPPQIDKFLAPESDVPSFSLPDLSGRNVSLKSLEGKTVLINFWATWCAPCVAEMPAMENLYNQLKQDNFEIVAISVDSNSARSNLERFVKDKNISFTILHDPSGEVGRKFGVEGIPESFFVDSKGRFIAFPDPVLGAATVRLVSDRPWDSEDFVASVKNVIEASQ